MVCEIPGATEHKQFKDGRFKVVGAEDPMPADCVECEIRWRLPKIDDVRPWNPEQIFDSAGKINDSHHIKINITVSEDTEIEIRCGILDLRIDA